MASVPATRAAAWSVGQRGEAGQHDRVGDRLGAVEGLAIGVGGLGRVVLPTEQLDVVRALDGMRDLCRQADRGDGGEVRTASHLAQHDRLVHRRRGAGSLGTGSARTPANRASDVPSTLAITVARSIDVGIETVDRAELPATVIVGARPGTRGRDSRGEHRPSRCSRCGR